MSAPPSQECKIQKRRIEHNVAVIRDKRVVHRRVEILYAPKRYAGSGLLGEHLQKRKHHLLLEIILSIDFQKILYERRDCLRRHYVVDRMQNPGSFTRFSILA